MCMAGFASSGRKKLRDPQDVLIEADRRQQLKRRRAQRRGTPQQ